MTASSLLTMSLFTLGIALFVCYARTGKLLRCIMFTAVSGCAALGAVWLAGSFVAVGLTVTPFTLLASALTGVPGVVGMLLLHLI